MEEVPVLVGNGSCGTQIAGCIGSFWLESDGAGFRGAVKDLAVQGVGVGNLLEAQVGIFDSLQSAEVVVGPLYV